MSRNVTVIWSMWHDDPRLAAEIRLHGKAVVTEATITVDSTHDDLALCERLFHDTNLYEGPLWDLIEPLLPANRSHTALSVGDHVVIDDRTYHCDRFGWSLVESRPVPHP